MSLSLLKGTCSEIEVVKPQNGTGTQSGAFLGTPVQSKTNFLPSNYPPPECEHLPTIQLSLRNRKTSLTLTPNQPYSKLFLAINWCMDQMSLHRIRTKRASFWTPLLIYHLCEFQFSLGRTENSPQEFYNMHCLPKDLQILGWSVLYRIWSIDTTTSTINKGAWNTHWGMLNAKPFCGVDIDDVWTMVLSQNLDSRGPIPQTPGCKSLSFQLLLKPMWCNTVYIVHKRWVTNHRDGSFKSFQNCT